MAEYHYLISSLPMLRWGEPPPLSASEFLDMCVPWLPNSTMKSLHSLTLIPAPSGDDEASETAAAWNAWEISFRNAIAKSRAGNLGREADAFLKPESDVFSEIENGLQEAAGAANPLERERLFDSMRWRRLEDLETGHIFDFERLCVYKLKLALLENIEARDRDKGEANLETILEKTSLS